MGIFTVMAHLEQACFCRLIRSRFSKIIQNIRVLEVGSLDVKGNNRYLFHVCSYVGLDIAPGNNVDIVSEFNEPDESFDTIISTECFEHDKNYSLSLNSIARLLKRDGLFLFTCATTGRKEHGTLRSDGGWASPLTSREDSWNDYYK